MDDVGCPLSIPFITIISKSQEEQLKFQSGKRLPSERRLAASSRQRGRSRKLRDDISIPNSKQREQTRRSIKQYSLKTHPPMTHFLQQKYPQTTSQAGNLKMHNSNGTSETMGSIVHSKHRGTWRQGWQQELLSEIVIFVKWSLLTDGWKYQGCHFQTLLKDLVIEKQLNFPKENVSLLPRLQTTLRILSLDPFCLNSHHLVVSFVFIAFA